MQDFKALLSLCEHMQANVTIRCVRAVPSYCVIALELTPCAYSLFFVGPANIKQEETGLFNPPLHGLSLQGRLSIEHHSCTQEPQIPCFIPCPTHTLAQDGWARHPPGGGATL